MHGFHEKYVETVYFLHIPLLNTVPEMKIYKLAASMIQ